MRAISSAKLFLVLALALPSLLGTATVAANGEATRMLRSPTISATHIAFAYANNIWVVERAGGIARRLTSFQGQTTNPKFSPDGQTIAFSARVRRQHRRLRRAGRRRRAEAADLASRRRHRAGLDARRRTRRLRVGARDVGADAAPRFWTVAAERRRRGSRWRCRARYQGKISPDGRRIAYRMNNSWDEERRNYRGGQNRPIWIVDLKTYDLVTPPWTDSKDIDPVWVGDTVYFISDRDGVANVWAFDPGSKQLTQQVTKFTDFDVKALDAGGGAARVRAGRASIHELDPKSGRAKVVNIRAAGDFPWMMPRWEDVTSRDDQHRPLADRQARASPKRAARSSRSRPRRATCATSRTRAARPSARRRGRPTASGSRTSATSRANTGWCIEAQDGIAPPREIALRRSPTFYYTPSWSPDSKKLLYTDTNLNVWVLDVASGQAKSSARDPWMVPQRTLHPSWSPDSRWVAFASRLTRSIARSSSPTSRPARQQQVTDGLADAMYPVWDASGKYLWFLASTDFGLRSQWLDMTSYDREETFGSTSRC